MTKKEVQKNWEKIEHMFPKDTKLELINQKPIALRLKMILSDNSYNEIFVHTYKNFIKLCIELYANIRYHKGIKKGIEQGKNIRSEEFKQLLNIKKKC